MRTVGNWTFDPAIPTMAVGMEFNFSACQVIAGSPFKQDRFDDHILNCMDDTTTSVRVDWDDDGVVTDIVPVDGWKRDTRPESVARGIWAWHSDDF